MRKRRTGALRTALPILILAMLAVGPKLGIVYGSICTLTSGSLTLSCPLGFLQACAASNMIISSLVIPATITVLVTVLVGRVFCGWMCPHGLIEDSTARLGKVRVSRVRIRAFGITLLLAVLAASALFHYPVFCLICPVGVICRNLISFSSHGTLGLDLMVIPTIILLETFLARWCVGICPLGITLSLLGRINILNPKIDETKCTDCSVCSKVCPMGIPLTEVKKPNLEDCTKCLKCSEKCPQKAISWALHKN